MHRVVFQWLFHCCHFSKERVISFNFVKLPWTVLVLHFSQSTSALTQHVLVYNYVLPTHLHTFTHIYTHSHTFTHIHTPMDASVGNVGFSVLPKDASTCGPEKLEMNHRPSYWATALPPELQPPLVDRLIALMFSQQYSSFGYLRKDQD